MKHSTRHWLTTLVTLAVTLFVCTGCERTEDDLKQWRDTKTGMQKMQTWAASPDEPMNVRIRALEIMLEEYEPSVVKKTLNNIKDDKSRQKLETAVVEKIEKMWATKDYPTVAKIKEKNNIGPDTQIQSFDFPLPSEGQEDSFSEAVMAKDGAFYAVQAIQDDALKKRLQKVLADWLAEEWRLRDNIGKVTLAQVVPYAGPEGQKHAMAWLRQTGNVSDVSKALYDQADDELKGMIAEVLVERAREKTPNVPQSLAVAVIKREHENSVPFLKEAVQKGYFSDQLLDASMNTIRKVEGPKSTDFFVGLIEDNPGPLRWAAVNDLILARNNAGVLSAAFSLPLQADGYAGVDSGRFQDDANWFGNFVAEESKNWDSDLNQTATRLLDSERWPARVLGLAVVKSADLTDLKSKVESMSDDSQVIPVWGEQKTVGELAGDIAKTLGS
jgi:predicted Fe-S protein YdhL (DUF1289 family)